VSFRPTRSADSSAPLPTSIYLYIYLTFSKLYATLPHVYWAPFEIFDPLLFTPKGCCEGGTTDLPVWANPFFSHHPFARPQLLSFITIWIAYVRFLAFYQPISLFLAPRAFFEGSLLARSFAERATHLYCFQFSCASFLPEGLP